MKSVLPEVCLSGFLILAADQISKDIIFTADGKIRKLEGTQDYIQKSAFTS